MTENPNGTRNDHHNVKNQKWRDKQAVGSGDDYQTLSED